LAKDNRWIKWVIATVIVGGILLGVASQGQTDTGDIGKILFILIVGSTVLLLRIYPGWKKAQKNLKKEEKI
jgi:mannose/fructose/N-acetylgalactosamine-specific phosphotransferase system component IID